MKTRIILAARCLVAVGAATLCPVLSSLAADVAAADSRGTTAIVPAKLSDGVDDVLKLSRAQVGEDVIINYIQSSGTVYNLQANDIVYLRKEGVGDRVINAMLDQRKKVTEAPAQTAPARAPAATPAPAAPETSAASQPAPVYVQNPPPQSAPSTVYVIPYPQATAAYYGYYGGYAYPSYYHRPYFYPYCGPSISLGFHFGGRHYGGGHYRGYHGRW